MSKTKANETIPGKKATEALAIKKLPKCRKTTTEITRAFTNIQKKQLDRFGEPIPTNVSKEERGGDAYGRTSGNLEASLCKILESKRKFYLVNSNNMLIKKGHKTTSCPNSSSVSSNPTRYYYLNLKSFGTQGFDLGFMKKGYQKIYKSYC